MATKKAESAIQTRDKKSKTAPKRKSTRKPPEELQKRGRKPWVPEYDNIERWSSQGLNDKSIAPLCGISHEEFCRKKHQFPQLKEALDKGKSKGESAVSAVLLRLALQGDKEMIKFYLSRRAGWNETIINKNLDLGAIDSMTPEELDELERSLGL